MAEDWAAIAAEVAGALSEFSPITIHEPGSDGGYDEMNDVVIDPTPPTDHEGSGVEDTYDAFSVANGVVEANDIKFLLAAVKTNGQPMPRPIPDKWAATLGGQRCAIKRVKPTQPAGMPVLFELQLRRS